MKKFSKILSVALLVALVLSLGVANAFAEDPAPVTIEIGSQADGYATTAPNAATLDDHTFKAYQILAAEEYDTNTKEYTGLSWGSDIDSASLFTALTASTSALKTEFANFVATAADVTEGKTLFTAASFAQTISSFTADQLKALSLILRAETVGKNATGTSFTEGTQGTLPGIGYYLVDDTTTLAAGDVANPVVLFAAPGNNRVQIKTEKPSQEKKVQENVKTGTWQDDDKYGDRFNDVADYNIGDYVPFEILSKVPNMEFFKDYDITFTDTMSTGLTFVNDQEHPLVVTIGGTQLAASAYTLKSGTDAAPASFTVKIVLKENSTAKYTAGDAIKLTFYGQLNTSAVIGQPGNTNKSSLTYSNNPDENTHTTTPEDTVIVFTYELDVTKIDGTTADKEAAQQTKLPGAEFVLKATSGEHIGKYAKVDANGKVSEWVTATATEGEDEATVASEIAGVKLVSGNDGLFKVIGLDDGTYNLIETKAPAGYNKLKDPIQLTITATTTNGQNEDGDGTELTALKIDVTVDGKKTTNTGDTATGIVGATVANNSGTTLPSTGGIGTTIFYVVGGVLVLAAIILLVTKKRMSE